MNSPLQKILNSLYNNFKKDTSKVLIITGVLGWGLSALAQMGAVVFNPKLSKDQKSFLFPQELSDGLVNTCSFLLITLAVKKFISKLASTGKIAPQSVRDFINKKPELKEKVGKLDLDLDKVLKSNSDFPTNSYYTYKNYITTVGTIGASIMATNVVTPILRNKMANKAHNKFMDAKTTIPAPNSYNSGMKI